jgi:hypothetical protein
LEKKYKQLILYYTIRKKLKLTLSNNQKLTKQQNNNKTTTKQQKKRWLILTLLLPIIACFGGVFQTCAQIPILLGTRFVCIPSFHGVTLG